MGLVVGVGRIDDEVRRRSLVDVFSEEVSKEGGGFPSARDEKLSERRASAKEVGGHASTKDVPRELGEAQLDAGLVDGSGELSEVDVVEDADVERPFRLAVPTDLTPKAADAAQECPLGGTDA